MRSEEMYKQAGETGRLQREQQHTQNSDVVKDWKGSDVCEHSAGWGQEGSWKIGWTAML